MSGIEDGWARRAKAAVGDRSVRGVLLAGHPSRAHLAAGRKGNLPVSKFNKWADEACGKQSVLAKAEVQSWLAA